MPPPASPRAPDTAPAPPALTAEPAANVGTPPPAPEPTDAAVVLRLWAGWMVAGDGTPNTGELAAKLAASLSAFGLGPPSELADLKRRARVSRSAMDRASSDFAAVVGPLLGSPRPDLRPADPSTRPHPTPG